MMRSQGRKKRPSGFKLESGLDLVASRPKLRVLRYLARHGGRLTGREIARVTGSAWARTSEALKEMVDAGLLIHRRVGRAIEYRLNEQHYLVGDTLLPAFQAERRWPQALGQEIARLGGSEVVSVILYGSVARGTPRAPSDLDLAVIVRPQADPGAVEARLSEHYSDLEGRYARPVSFLVMDTLDLRRRLRQGDRLAKAIVTDGRVLAGMEMPDLLVAHRQRRGRQGGGSPVPRQGAAASQARPRSRSRG